MANTSRNRIERYYESLVQCFKKVNDLHESITADHCREEICENYTKYIRNMPVHKLEKTAACLDGRQSYINFISTNLGDFLS